MVVVVIDSFVSVGGNGRGLALVYLRLVMYGWKVCVSVMQVEAVVQL